MEDIQTKIREWIVKEKETTGAFPDIPDEESGGCRFLFFPEENVSEVKEESAPKKGKDADGEVEGWKVNPSEQGFESSPNLNFAISPFYYFDRF